MKNSSSLLWDLWQNHAAKIPGKEAVVHWKAGEEPYRWTWEGLVASAASYAENIRENGIRKGEVCAIILRHHREFYPLYLGITLVGAIPSILAYPNTRLHPEKFRQGLEGMARHSGLDWIFTEKSLEDTIDPFVNRKDGTVRGTIFPLEWDVGTGSKEAAGEMLSRLRREANPDDPCLLQHSSGTTGLQKAVVLSHTAVREHVRLYGESIRLGADDKIASWLPLYHDMGLIAAFQLPLAWGIPSIQIDTFEWIQNPVMLLDAISREKGTLAWLPNFTYNLLADRVHEDDLKGIRLDSVRMLINCSEPVREESHEKFLRRFDRYGMRQEALGACYAMAETTFAATQTAPGVRARALAARRDDLSRGRFVPAGPGTGNNVKHCVSSGHVIAGCGIKVVDDRGEDLPEGNVGEIAIRSVSLFEEYRNQPEKTAEVLKDGWYYSGDYGFLYEEEWYVIGRKKDVIIVAGGNIAPEDVEDAVNEVPGVIPGRCVAFGVEDVEAGTEQVCVVAETAETGEKGLKALRRAIGEAGIRIDVTISRVFLVSPRWLIKSSSGKLSRKVNKKRVLERFLPEESGGFDTDLVEPESHVRRS